MPVQDMVGAADSETRLVMNVDDGSTTYRSDLGNGYGAGYFTSHPNYLGYGHSIGGDLSGNGHGH